MPLVVEDGTGLAGAESYLAVTAFKAWADGRGYSYAGKTDLQVEQALRRGTAYVDATYGALFTGARVKGRDQALEWPRAGASDYSGVTVGSTSVPAEILNGTGEAALRELAARLNPDLKPGGGVVRRVKAASVEVEFAPGAGPNVKTYPAIDAALARLIGQRSSFYVGI